MNRSNCGESRMNWLRPLGPCSMAGRGKSRMPRSRNSFATLDRLHHQLCERTQQDGRKLSPPLRRAVQRVIELTQLFLMPNDSSTMYVEYAAELGDSKQIVSLNAVPKDLPQHLYTTLWSQSKPTIMTSGTLAAGDGFRQYQQAAGTGTWRSCANLAGILSV